MSGIIVRKKLWNLFRLLGSIVLILGIIAASSRLLPTSAADKDDCEIVISQADGRTVYAINPDLSPEGQATCEETIKEQHVATWEEQQTARFVPGQLLVKFKKGAGNSERTRVFNAHGIGRVIHTIDAQHGILQVAVTHGSEKKVAAALKVEALVEYAEPNFYAQALDSPSWGQDAVGAPLAWTEVTCDPAIGVAVVDTGINLAHSEFAGGHAYYGWNFVADTADAADDNGHGTHVASTVGGATVGICPDTTIVAYKVLDATGSGTYADIANAIISATSDIRVRIINLSLGGYSASSTLQSAVDQAAAAGKLVFAAAGNGLGRYPGYPANYTSTISVGAVDADWRLTTWSSREQGAETRSLVAPGVDIVGADYTCDTCYITHSGTSMATPHSAGAAALVWSSDPALTSAQVKDYLLDNTVPLGDASDYGRGGLNVAAAVKAATGATYNLPPVVIWPIPWPGLAAPDNPVKILARLRDLDGNVVSATATVDLPGGGSVDLPMSLDAQGFWEAEHTPTVLGDYTANVSSVSDGAISASSLGNGVTFHVVDSRSATGWPQLGQQASGGSYIPITVDITTGQQLYSQYNSLSASTNQGAECLLGRCDVPRAVGIAGGTGCPLSGDWGSRWVHDALLGIYETYTQPYASARELTCADGVGVFNDTGAQGGQLFTMDEGGTRSDTQDARLHSFDPVSGRQYWLTQLDYYSGDGVKLSQDGWRAYTTHSVYGALQAVNAVTGERLWRFPGTISGQPVESGGRVFVNVSSGGVFALDAESGAEVWQYTSPLNSSFGRSSPAVSPDGSTVIICDGSSTVRALATSNGAPGWSTPLGSGYCNSTPAITPDYVVQYVTGSDNQDHLYLLSLATGEVVAHTVASTYGSTVASPAVVGDLVFLTDYDGEIAAYRLPTLTNVWSYDFDGAISSWQTSAQVGQDATGTYVLVLVSSNNGIYRAWRFYELGAPEPTVTPTLTNTPTFTPPPTGTPSPTPIPTVSHVGDLDGLATRSGNRWTAQATITIHNFNHQPLVGVVVAGSWSGGYTGAASCTTNALGQCSLMTGNMSTKRTSVTLTLTNATLSGYTYQAAANHDPDNDSNGTVITVNRP